MIIFKWIDKVNRSSKVETELMSEEEFKLFVSTHIGCDFIYESINSVNDAERLFHVNDHHISNSWFGDNYAATIELAEKGIQQVLYVNQHDYGVLFGNDIPSLFEFAKCALEPNVAIMALLKRDMF